MCLLISKKKLLTGNVFDLVFKDLTYEVSENLTAKCFESSIVKAEPSEVNDFFSHFNVDPEQGMPLVRFK